MNVLIFDADNKEREMIRNHLSSKGLKTTEITGGLQMLEDKSQFKKDLVLLDYETWRKNRSIYRYFGVEKIWVGVPMIIMGTTKTDIFQERHPHSEDACIKKPMDMTELDALLDRFTSGKK
jgi:DNA-binding response OmpR family regulator